MLSKEKRDDPSFGELLDPSHHCCANSNTSESDASSEKSKWGVVWAEATLIPNDETVCSEHEATVVSIDDPEVASGGNKEEISSHCGKGSFIDTIVGFSIALGALASTLGLEMAAAILFVLASGFYCVCQWIQEIGPVCSVFNGIFMGVVFLLLFVDSVLLWLSVVLTEILANVAWLLCFLFGGRAIASGWRKYIRRICHLSRWAFRDFHEEWSLRRDPMTSKHKPTEGNDKPTTPKC